MQKTLLDQLLSNKPAETITLVSAQFAGLPCNLEFAVSVNTSRVQQHMDEANERGFIAWCNQDAKSAIIYGAGLVSPDGFADCMTWLRRIRIESDVALVHLMANDGDKVLVIQ